MSTESINFDAWDESINTKELNRQVTKLQANSGERVEVPLGSYEVALDNIMLTVSKQGKKQMACFFDIVAGEYQGQSIPVWYTLDHPDQQKLAFMFHNANEFLRSLKTSVEIKGCLGYRTLNEIITEVKKEIIDNGWEYQLKVGEGKNGYKEYTIVEKFDKNENPF